MTANSGRTIGLTCKAPVLEVTWVERVAILCRFRVWRGLEVWIRGLVAATVVYNGTLWNTCIAVLLCNLEKHL